jgi:hypothetical protein
MLTFGVSGRPEPARRALAAWSDSEPWHAIAPPTAEPHERDLFAADFRAPSRARRIGQAKKEREVMNPQFPAGGDELRRLAIEATRCALNDCGRATGEGDPLPAELVNVAAQQQCVPISTLVGYIQFCPRQQQITPEAFVRHCRAALRQAPAGDDERYPSGDGDVCR